MDSIRSVLDNFCFKMTEAQYKNFASTLKATPEGMVHYVNMLDEIDGAPMTMMVRSLLSNQIHIPLI